MDIILCIPEKMTNQLKGFFSAYELAKTIQIASPEIYIV